MYLLTVILSATMASITAAAIPLANATATDDPVHIVGAPKDIHGGYWDQCYDKGYLRDRGFMAGNYTAQCPPPDASGFEIWETELSLNHCFINVNGFMYWQAA